MNENTDHPRWGRLLTTVVAGAAALGLATATSAAADTSAATANAVTVGALGTSLVGSGTVTAGNDGSKTTQTAAAAPALSVLGGQGGITAGALVQTAVAGADGSSVACAGLVGNGGSITVGTDGTCTATGGTGGVAITLVAGTILKADAILASCSATSTPKDSSTVALVGARVTTGGLTVLSLPAKPAEDRTLSVPGIATLGLHGTTRPATGTVKATALTITLLGGAAAAVNIGTVTCGANAKVVPADALPGPAVPLAAAALVALGWRFHEPVREALRGKGSHGV